MMKGVVGPMSIREEALRSDPATEVGPHVGPNGVPKRGGRKEMMALHYNRQ